MQRAAGDVPQGTGNVTGTSGSAGNVTGATSTGLREQSVTRTESTTYARNPGTAATGQSASRTRSGREASTGTGLGGVLAMVAGLLTFFAGLAAVVRASFYPLLAGYPYRLNVHAWGWILLVLGVLLFAAGATHLLGMSFGRIVGAGLAVLVCVAGFLWVPYAPIWGLIVVALGAVAIWSLLSDGEADRGGGADGAYGYDEAYGDRYAEGSTGAGSMSSGTTTTTTTTTGTRSRHRL
jgi:hypothetical protein